MDEIVVAKILAAHPRTGLELQWELEGDDEDTRWTLELHVIVELAGPEHGRYSTIALHRWPGEEIDERRAAHRAATEIAERVRLPLYSVDIEQRGGQGGSGWIRRQPSAETDFEVAWEVSWWTDDAEPRSEAGTEVVRAVSGKEARFAMYRMLDARYPWRPISFVIRVGLETDTTNRAGSYDGMPVETIRDAARLAPVRASQIARAIVEHDPQITPLQLVLAFQAFSSQFARYLPVARWRRGEIEDAVLDAAVSPVIEVNTSNWDRPRCIREAYATGSLAAFLREDWPRSRLGLIRDLREVFDLGLSESQDLIEDVVSGRETAPERRLALRP